MPQLELLALVAAGLLAGCTNPVKVSLVAERQPADRIEFVIKGAIGIVYDFTVYEEVRLGQPPAPVWRVRQGMSGELPRRVRYGVSPRDWTTETPPATLQPDRVYCAYVKTWARACFRVNRDGTATPASP